MRIINNNRGGGKFDYVVFAPTMDLGQWTSQATNKDYLFAVYLQFDDLDGGFEELSISGTFAPPNNVVPEPATMLLWGTGLLGTALVKRKNNKKRG